MKEKFSLLKAIEARANGRNLDEVSLEVVEAGKAEMRKSGLSYSGDASKSRKDAGTIPGTC